MKRTIRDLFVKLKKSEELAKIKHLNIEMGFTNKWIKKVETWVVGSLKQLSSKIKEGLKKK